MILHIKGRGFVILTDELGEKFQTGQEILIRARVTNVERSSFEKQCGLVINPYVTVVQRVLLLTVEPSQEDRTEAEHVYVNMMTSGSRELRLDYIARAIAKARYGWDRSVGANR
jgi:hypothetical protein